MRSLVELLTGRPWAIRGDLAAHVQGLVAREGFAGLRHLAELKRGVHAFDGDERGPDRLMARRVDAAGGGTTVAVVPIIGMLTQRGDFINSAETRSTAAVADEVAALAADSKVDAVVLEIDSPGGEVSGVPEAYLAIRAAAGVKPVVAAVNSQMASAALYLGAAATEIIITPSGEAGSLGVYALHVDESAAMEAEGVKAEFVVADDSPHKVEGNSLGPLSDDARDQIKRSVNRYMGMFVRDVARGRKKAVEYVRENFGKGRMLSPAEAVQVGMADSVGTLQQAIRRAAALGKERREQARTGPAAVVELPEPLTEEPASPVVAARPVLPAPVVGAQTDEQRAALRKLGAL